MKKLVTIGLSICLTLGLAGFSMAGKEKKDPLADITIEPIEGTCSWGEDEIAINMDDVTPLEVSWTATQKADEPLYSKFGGDAKFKAFQVIAYEDGDPLPAQDVVIDIGLMLEDLAPSSDPDGPYEPMGNEFVYDDEGTDKCTSPCTANLANIQLAIMLALDEQFGSSNWEITEGVSFLGVFLKAMNPGKGGGRQDYVQEVCGFYEVEEPEVAATD